MTKQVIFEVGATVIVDREALVKLSNDELTATMQTIYGSKKDVLYVEKARNFFSFANLENAIDTTSDTLPVLLAYHEIHLSDADLDILKKSVELRKYISAAFEAKREASRPAYPFADTPKGWDFDKELVITAQLIRRTGTSQYSIGLKTAQKLWETFAPRWAGDTSARGHISVRAAGYDRTAYVYTDYIDIGCQQVQRYELEAVALHFGWEFPKTALPE